jgi:NTP pyrophosphatase (non-canonical NTP hydrolase)
MQLNEYQRAARRTDQRPEGDLTSVAIALLGLAGEAGSVAEEYKKYLRDGSAHKTSKVRLREELGDVLWYVAALATRFDLDLDDVAVANLSKVTDLWRPSGEIASFDDGFPEQRPGSFSRPRSAASGCSRW